MKMPHRIPGNYGFFGYEGYVCDLAIRNDDVEMLTECIHEGFMDKETVTLCPAYTMLQYARKYKAVNCVAHL